MWLAARKKDPAAARIIKDMQKRFISVVDAENPGMKPARHAWAGGKALENAIEFGKDIRTAGIDEWVASFNALSASEKYCRPHR